MSVVVHGSGPIELAAALEFASVGVAVTVIDDAVSEWQHLVVEDPDGAVAEWIREASDGQIDAVVAPAPNDWIEVSRGSDRFAPIPPGAVFGIPSSPLSVDVSAVIGGRGAFRAYLDRLMPILTIGQTTFFGDLVRKRIGPKALKVFVEPLVRHRFGLHPNETAVAELAPGLSETVSRVGSLTGGALAYADRYESLTATVSPEGGWPLFEDQLRQRLTHFGVAFVPNTERVDDAQVVVTRMVTEPTSSRTHLRVEVERPPWWPQGGERVIRTHEIGTNTWTSAVSYQSGAGFSAELRSEVSTSAPVSVPDLHEVALTGITDPFVVHRVDAGRDGHDDNLVLTALPPRPDAFSRTLTSTRQRSVELRRKILGIA